MKGDSSFTALPTTLDAPVVRAPPPAKPLSTLANFTTAGIAGCIGWVAVHPFNTLAIRMSLASQAVGASGGAAPPLSFAAYSLKTVREHGAMQLYSGLSAGLLRQVFYATSRFGLFEVVRDELAKRRPVDFASRLTAGCVSGALAALISCPAEVTLVRISNDATQPADKRRNYRGVLDAFQRIFREEGAATFFRGSGPFVNRAILVGAVQVGTYDQFRASYRALGITHELQNVFAASMTSGLLYSVVTMPFETAKNRMAFQKPDPVTGLRPYTGAIQTIRKVASEGVLRLWTGFAPYYLRCGGHTVAMFISLEWLRTAYANSS